MKANNLDLDFLIGEKKKRRGEELKGDSPDQNVSEEHSDLSFRLSEESTQNELSPNLSSGENQNENAEFVQKDGADAESNLDFDINEDAINLAKEISLQVKKGKDDDEQSNLDLTPDSEGETLILPSVSYKKGNKDESNLHVESTDPTDSNSEPGQAFQFEQETDKQVTDEISREEQTLSLEEASESDCYDGDLTDLETSEGLSSIENVGEDEKGESEQPQITNDSEGQERGSWEKEDVNETQPQNEQKVQNQLEQLIEEIQAGASETESEQGDTGFEIEADDVNPDESEKFEIKDEIETGRSIKESFSLAEKDSNDEFNLVDEQIDLVDSDSELGQSFPIEEETEEPTAGRFSGLEQTRQFEEMSEHDRPVSDVTEIKVGEELILDDVKGLNTKKDHDQPSVVEKSKRTKSRPLVLPKKDKQNKSSFFGGFRKDNKAKVGHLEEKLRQKKSKGKQLAKSDQKNILTTSISLASLLENSRFLGLDIGTRSIKYVHLKKTARGLKLISCGNYAIPETSIDTNKEDKDQDISQVIRKHFNSKNFKNTLITSAVSGMEVFFKNIQVPKMAKKELSKAVPWACRKDFPFPIESTVFAFRNMGDKKKKQADNKLDIFVVAAQKELITSHLEVLQNAQIMPTKLSTIPVALWNLFRLSVKKEVDKCHCIVDIGADFSHIVFINHGQLQFAREISTAGLGFTEALTGAIFIDGKEIKLTKERAEKIKRKYGIPQEMDDSKTEEGIPLKEVSVMMGPILERLVNDIQRTVEFFKEKFHVDAIERIYLTGGGALMRNLPSILTRELNLKVRLLNPFDDISLKKFRDQKNILKMGPRFSVPVGLALDRNKDLNLLPDEFKGSHFYQYLKKLYRYIFVILILGMVFLSQDVSRQFKKVQAEFGRRNSEYNLAAPKREKYLSLQKTIRNLTRANESYGNSFDANLNAANHLKVIGHHIPANITLTSFRVVYRRHKDEDGENKFYDQEIVILDGIAFESDSMGGINLANFLLKLEKSRYFRAISLKAQKIREDGSLQFTIECET